MNAAIRSGLAAVLCMAASMAMAQNEATRVAAKSDWSIFAEEDPKQCWVVSAPKETVNTRDGRVVAVRRGDIYMFVSFWPGSEKLGEVSFQGGYPFAPGSTVAMQVGDSKFELFTDGEMAWAATPEDDRRIATALKRGVEAVITGRSSRGTTTKDTFSLIGFTAAYDDAMTRCGG
ncbi:MULTISPECIES: invasion associated locus B family protein [unclassified Meridianimarinicoccus]|uniref:invasion associated locus B family protein n=1 Tax=unclassified Meridianimarinicoccus TaxID=2923344 RepID=UPI00186602CE